MRHHRKGKLEGTRPRGHGGKNPTEGISKQEKHGLTPRGGRRSLCHRPRPRPEGPHPLLRVWASTQCVLSVGACDRSPNGETGAQGNKGAPSVQHPCSVLRVWPEGGGSPHLATAGPRALRLPLLPEALLGGEEQNTKKGFSS